MRWWVRAVSRRVWEGCEAVGKGMAMRGAEIYREFRFRDRDGG